MSWASRRIFCLCQRSSGIGRAVRRQWPYLWAYRFVSPLRLLTCSRALQSSSAPTTTRYTRQLTTGTGKRQEGMVDLENSTTNKKMPHDARSSNPRPPTISSTLSRCQCHPLGPADCYHPAGPGAGGMLQAETACRRSGERRAGFLTKRLPLAANQLY